MKSVYTNILLWSVGILALSFVALHIISRSEMYDNFQRGSAFGGLLDLQADEAKHAYETGGRQALSAYLESLESIYPGTHRFLLNTGGQDLLTGADRSPLWAKARSGRTRLDLTGPILTARLSRDANYVLVFAPAYRNIFQPFRPYYLLLLGAIALLCWVIAFQLASPLKELAETVRRFGAGDLAARVNSKRRDEIGDVARAFDEMARRIETLLNAERRLLQDISHELRSPLARLSFAAELARTSPDREGAVVRVNKEIQRLTDLVESLLEVTRAEGDPSARSLDRVALSDLLADLVENCNLEANAHGCRMVMSGSTHLILRADRELLRRALENILRNAIRHAPAGSNIEIILNRTTANASVSVRDYGPGIPPKALTSIFKPFFRVDTSRDTSTGGVGLGLAIAQRAIHIHHGRVWAENAEPGLRVCVDLPLEDPA
jgi:signal transduction histidine kinase